MAAVDRLVAQAQSDFGSDWGDSCGVQVDLQGSEY